MKAWVGDVLIGLTVSVGTIIGGYGLRVWLSAMFWLAEVFA